MNKPAPKRMRQALSAKILAGIGGFLAAVLSLGYSVYEARTAGEVPRIEPGVAIDAGRWSVTLRSASLADELPGGGRLAAGSKALVLDVTMENRTAESSNIYLDLLKLRNVTDAPRPQFYLERDQDILWSLQPAMPEALKVVWQVPADQALPKVIDVAVTGAIFKPMDNLYAAPGWFDTDSVATVALPLAAGTEDTP